jgi:malate dehydrogenase (oxaloacetate-decarboxylating)(NADP+)
MAKANSEERRAQLRRAALEYHEFPTPGKISIAATKQLVNQHDLALAYSPGVAAPCEEIVKDPAAAFKYTSRGNLVGVVTNGTAVLGLGDIGPLAGKPVMEGKAVLFKKFSGIDVFDIEINEKDPEKLVEIIASLEPTFGGINLEDIKAPDCFYVERKLRERMKIPVFHDDQHGTAITVGAAILNGLKVVGKDPSQVKLVTSGAGAAALACLGLLLKLGIRRENIWVTDLAGLVYEGRTELMDEDKIQFSQKTSMRTLAEAIDGADVFLGLSAGGVLKQDMVKRMAAKPLIFALANPTQKSCRKMSKQFAMMPSWPRAALTIPTKSTMFCASPIFSEGPWTVAQPPSRRRWKLRRCMPLPNWRKQNKAKWWRPPMLASPWSLVRNTSSPNRLIRA